MKVLLVTLEYPPFVGGVATYLEKLVAHAPQGDVVHVHVVDKLEHWLITAWKILRLVWKHHYERIVVSHCLPVGYAAWIVKMMTGAPYAVITHGTDILTARRVRRKRFFMRFILRHASYVVANSAFTATLLKEENVLNPTIVYPCIDRTANVGERVSSSVPYILSIGRLVPRKGFDTAIRALVSIRKTIPDVRYVIIGEGPDRARLEALADQMGVSQCITFAGHISDSEKNSWLLKSDVYLHPSREETGDVEGFGISIIEASAAGLPVMVGASGGAIETVEDGSTGILINPLKSDECAKVVVDMLSHPDKARSMGEAGRRFVALKFNCVHTSRIFWNLLHV